MQIKGAQVAASATAAEIKLNCFHLMVTNDGSETIYLSIEQGEDYPGVVTADSSLYFPLAAGEVLVIDTLLHLTAINYICDAGKTSYLRYAAWR